MLHEHHRQLRRGGDERPVNKIMLPDVIHQWVHDNPKEAMEAGLIVSQYEDPANIGITIPEDALKKVSAPRKMEKPRNRATISFKVPKDKREDGAGLFDDLWEQAETKMQGLSGPDGSVVTEGETGQYGLLLAVLYQFVMS